MKRGIDRIGPLKFRNHVVAAHGLRIDGDIARHAPVRHVHPVQEQIGERAAAEIPEPAPVAVTLGVERLIGRGAQEHLPIELGGVDRRARVASQQVILIPIGADESHLAQTAVGHNFARLLEVRPAALLHAGLDHALRFGDGLEQRRALFDAMRVMGMCFTQVIVRAASWGRPSFSVACLPQERLRSWQTTKTDRLPPQDGAEAAT
jgi:hypothetical protein